LRLLVQRQEQNLKQQASSIDEVRMEVMELKREVNFAVQAKTLETGVVNGFATAPQVQIATAAGGANMAEAITDMSTGSFTMYLDKSTGGELGLELDERTLTVTAVDEVGLVSDWNRAGRGPPVLPGCRILEVNGAIDTEQIFDRLIRDVVLEVTLTLQ